MSPQDRVLLLLTPDEAGVRRIAAQVTAGVVVVICPESDVRTLRAACADLENAMFLPADPAGAIPWLDGFFTQVVATELTPEIARVLAPGGQVRESLP